MDIELYAIGYYEDDDLKRLVRKGRGNAIVGYDNISSAKRGLSQTLANGNTGDYRILKATDLTEV